jgi:hypothetical protein
MDVIHFTPDAADPLNASSAGPLCQCELRHLPSNI